MIVAALLLTACVPAASTRPPTVALHVLPDAGPRPFLRALDDAHRSIDLEVYLLTHPQVLGALRAAHTRGVRVRVLLEEHPFGEGTNTTASAELQRAGVETRWTSPQFALTHAKTALLDREMAWVMTANLTRAAFQRNREYLAALTDPAAVADLAAIFDADWSQAASTATPAALVVSPSNARARLTALIDQATTSLDVEAEEMVDTATTAALERAATRGVAVRLIMSPAEAGAPDSSAAAREGLARRGAQVRLLHRPYVHAKLVLADTARLYVGSINFSAQSLDRNREVGVLVDTPPALDLARATFERDWVAAR